MRVQRKEPATQVGRFVAILFGLLGAIVLALLLLYVPHWMVKGTTWGSRNARVAVATVWMIAATVALLWLTWRSGARYATTDDEPLVNSREPRV